VVDRAVTTYQEQVGAAGFQGLLASTGTDQVIQEQSCLIAGFLWLYARRVLPWLHQHYRVLSVEEERIQILDCTCGAGPLPALEHDRRDCRGVGLMSRCDLLAQHRQGRHLAYFEGKTTGWESDAWADQWETTPQLALGTLDAAQRFGAEVTELYIVAFTKGRRTRSRTDSPEAPKQQQSPLCYGYCRPANPPLAAEDWLPSYEWAEPDGTVRRASRAHRKRGLWELGTSDWPYWLARLAQDPKVQPAEVWVESLPESVSSRILTLIGPLNRQDDQLASLVRAIPAEERRWQERLWQLYESQGDPVLLDQLFPQSWHCRPFGREHQCPYVLICFKHEGWQDPIGSGHFRPRTPHHAPELLQARARGLDPEAGGIGEED